ncbi:MAG: dTDP-4-dehydrorhamnose reductase [Candidatus Latescibacterota bacterium]
MRVLITGASGRVGRALLASLPGGTEAEVLLEPSVSEIGYPSYHADITDRNGTVMAVTCAAPDVLVHLAAMTDVDGCERNPGTAFRVNRDGVAHLAEACAACGSAMVYISTDYVFDGRSGPYTETDQPNPVSEYGRSKHGGELAAAEWAEKLSIIRISVPFGPKAPGVGHNFISFLDEKLAAGEEVRVVTDQFTTPSWLDELAEFIWAVIRREERGIIHYGASDRPSRYDMAIGLCRVRGYDERLVIPITTAELELLAPRPLESGFVTARAAAILGRLPISYGEAIERM